MKKTLTSPPPVLPDCGQGLSALIRACITSFGTMASSSSTKNKHLFRVLLHEEAEEKKERMTFKTKQQDKKKNEKKREENEQTIKLRNKHKYLLYNLYYFQYPQPTTIRRRLLLL